MHTKRNLLLAAMGVAGALLMQVPAAQAQAGKTFVMKLSTATINDTQHEWLKRFGALVEKNSGGRIKAEIYPASQLGSIPRQIEGVQFGSIQGWMGPPEFLVGVDERFEAPSAPGLFSSIDQVMKVVQDQKIQKMMYDWGSAKGLEGVGFAPIGPSSILTRKQTSKLADIQGMKIRVLASPFQLELMRRMGASPIAMTLADVMPALQQGTIDGVLTTITVHTTMHYYDVGKSILQTEQPFVNSMTLMSKRWMATLPPDLQKVVRDAGVKVTAEITPFVRDFFAEQEKVFVQHGGTLHNLPKAEHDEMIKKISTIGDDLSKSKPALNQAVKAMFEAAARHK
ncbi:MAG TPA: TRAP transporter substrate-binding protein [Xanthobacteraceae bacterium]|jgi:TRAP-type C4-dicarboxylate transport system substrate-binding protein|nr:TRAP transporter substrate-binding protein [Xanthobacteraceae bacterium]